jgi:outer membrane protein assembly factor BamB
MQACGGKRNGFEGNIDLTWGRLGVFVSGFQSRPVSLRGELGADHIDAPLVSTGGRQAFAQMDWRPGTAYQFFLVTEDGSTHSLDGTSPLKPSPVLVQIIDLDNILPFLGRQQVSHRPTFVRFSPRGDRLALGTSEGYVAAFDTLSGETIWSDRISEGQAKNAAFSRDGSVLYIGEQAPDGFVYAFSMNATKGLGKVLWKYRLADDLGTSLPVDASDQHAWIQFPGTYRVLTHPEGDLLVLSSHSWEDTSGGHARSCLYRLDGEHGVVRWRWPSDAPCPLTTMWFDSSADGRTLALVAHERHGGTNDPLGRFVPGTIYLVNGGTGEEIASYTIPPLKPYFKSVIFWRSVALRPDGRSLCATSGDGRGFLFDLETIPETGFVPQRVLELATPFESGGIPVVATVGTIAALQNAAIFVTGSSYIPIHLRDAAEEPPSLHPNGNTCFAFDWNGHKLWQYRMTNSDQGIAVSSDGRFIALPLSSGEVSSFQSGERGVVLLDTTRSGSGDEKYLYTYSIEGTIPYDTIDISPDGLCVAVAEVPFFTSDRGETRGKSRVHIVH